MAPHGPIAPDAPVVLLPTKVRSAHDRKDVGDGVVNKTHIFYKDNTMPLEPTNMVERLRKFVAAVNGKRPPYHGLFLELFSGIGSVSTAIRNRNHAAIPVDFETQLCIDLTLPGVVQLIISWIKTGMVLRSHFGSSPPGLEHTGNIGLESFSFLEQVLYARVFSLA